LNGRNSPWRTREVARTVGSREAARWIEVGRTHPFGFKNQRGPLIVVRLSIGSFLELGVHEFGGGRPNPWSREVSSCEKRGRDLEPLDLNKQEQPWDQKPLRYIAYRGFRGWEESVSTAGVAKWREPRARVNAWHICQVGTARVTGGMYSRIEGSTHSFPIASQDFAKEKSTKRKSNHRLSLNTSTREIASCEKCSKGSQPSPLRVSQGESAKVRHSNSRGRELREVLVLSPSRRSRVEGADKEGAIPIS
jgi:hypothetical protein